MPNPSVTHTFSNGTTADATQVNQNFTDLINALTDGTKDITVAAITATGSVSFDGNVTLGNGTPDDIAFSGSLASSIPIKTNNTFDIGTATLALASIYLGAPSSRTIRLLASQSLASSYTLTLPASAGSAGNKLLGNGSGGLTFGNDGPTQADNYGLTASVSSNQLTIALKGADSNDPSATNPVYVSSRNTTAATGTPSAQTITSAMSIVLPSGASLGSKDAAAQYVHVYLIFGTSIEIAVSGQRVFDEGALQSATAVTSGSTSATTLYATSNHASKPIRYIGRVLTTQTTAGVWAAAPTEVSPILLTGVEPRSEVFYDTAAGYGGTNTKVPYFTNQRTLTGTAFTITSNDNTSGLRITINEDGIYTISASLKGSAGSISLAIVVNGSAYTTNASALTYAQGRRMYTDSPTSSAMSVSWTGFCRTGDIINIQTDANAIDTGAGTRNNFSACKVH